jgi:O-antigen/teichoic acid export membrane protein
MVTGVAADLTIAASSLLLSILISRILGPENRGLYFLTVFGATLIAYIADLGMSVVAIVYGAQRRLLRQIHFVAVAVALGAGGVTAGILLGASDFWTRTVFKGFTPELLMVLALGVAPMVYTQIGSAALAGLGDVPTLSAVRIAGAVVLPVVSVPIAYATHGDPLWTAAAWWLVVTVLAASCLLLLVMRGMTFALPTRRELRMIFGFGLSGYVGNLSQYGFLRLDIVFVSSILGASAVGSYSLASMLAERTWLIGSALYHASARRIGASEPAEGAEYSARLVRILLVLLVPPTAAAGVTAFIWLPLLYGDAFGDAVAPFVLLLPGAVCLAVWYVLALFVISGLRRPGLTSAAQSCVFALSAPAYYFAIHAWGITGAAVVSSVAYAMVLAFGLAIYTRSTGVPARRLFPRKRDVQHTMSLLLDLLRHWWLRFPRIAS